MFTTKTILLSSLLLLQFMTCSKAMFGKQISQSPTPTPPSCAVPACLNCTTNLINCHHSLIFLATQQCCNSSCNDVTFGLFTAISLTCNSAYLSCARNCPNSDDALSYLNYTIAKLSTIASLNIPQCATDDPRPLPRRSRTATSLSAPTSLCPCVNCTLNYINDVHTTLATAGTQCCNSNCTTTILALAHTFSYTNVIDILTCLMNNGCLSLVDEVFYVADIISKVTLIEA